MHFLLIIDDYLPYSTRVGAKMCHELALEMLSCGHNVTVITPNSLQENSFSESIIDGVTVWSFKNGPVKNVNKIRRAINESVLSIRAWRAIRKRLLVTNIDGVIYYSPSIFWGGLVAKIKKTCHCPAYLVLRDIFPLWAIDSGLIRRNSLVAKYFRLFEKFSYQQADYIGLMSERNLEVFEKIHAGYRCEVLRNWSSIEPVPRDLCHISIRDRLGLQGKVIYFYGGNIGHAQDMANLMRLAKSMLHHNRAHFLFVGQGDQVSLVNELADMWGLENFTYLPSVSQSEYKQILNEIDVGLFSLAKQHTSHNFPGKLLGYMLYSLPILGSVNDDNDLQYIINDNNAGFVHINGDDESLLESAVKLLDDNLRTEMGFCGLKLLKTEFSVSSAAKLIEDRIRGIYESYQ